MLRFITGPAASGKTFKISELIKKEVTAERKPILLVPEQFSFESERMILSMLGDCAAQRVSVMSFTRLCDELERQTGGITGKSLTDSDKFILMHRAVNRAEDRLKYWHRYSSSDGFVKGLVDIINEFKLNAISADDLLSAADKSDESALSAKLSDISYIYSEYNLLLNEKFIDPSDRLDKLYIKLESYRFFEGRTVFIDSFKSFTGQQYKILNRILSSADDVYISLTLRSEHTGEYGVFAGIVKTKQRILRLAQSHGIPCGEDIILKENHYVSRALAQVEKLMAGVGDDEEIDLKQNVTVCRAKSVFDEAEFAARSIRRLVRTSDIRYRDCVIIARDTVPYEEALTAACERNGVSCFIDRRLPLSSLPPARAVLAAVELCNSLTTEGILSFCKSGIDIISSEELSLLENYTYLWNIDGRLWYQDWNMNPAGFVSGVIKPEARAELEKINQLRIKIITPLEQFKKRFKGKPYDMVRALVELLEECGAKNAFLKLEDQYRHEGKLVFVDSLRRSWDSLMELLDSLTLCFEDAEISVSEFTRALKSASNSETVGVTPQGLDEVTFGAADRIRPLRPKYAFILGANQGGFPKAQSSSGVLRGQERRSLLKLGIDISDRFIDSAIDENFLVYSNVCCPTQGLFVSYLASDVAGASPSAFVSQIASCVGCNTVNEPERLSIKNIPETVESAFSEYCKRYSHGNEGKLLEKPLSENGDVSMRLSAVTSETGSAKEKLSNKTARELFGEKLEMSPSKLDCFNNCHFMFFCRYGLKVKKLQPADFDAMQRGTLIHFVLQRIIEKYGKGISALSSEEISEEVDLLTDEYLDGITGYRSVETPRSRFLVSTMTRSIKYIVGRLSAEFSQSEFEPMKCELRIGASGEIPAIEIPAENGAEMTISGIVDRIDTWNGYIRIIDYKTGNRDFKLPDILFGQNLQMLIYLYAIKRSGRFGEFPAGIFYMPAHRIKDGQKANRRMNGIMLADKELVCAMEKLNQGEFVPKLSEKPSESFINEGEFERIFDFIDKKLRITAKDIYDGRIDVNPVDGIGNNACKYCDFAALCKIEDKAHGAVPRLTNEQVMQMIESEAEDDGV